MKRVISALLACVMVLSVLAAVSFAEGTELKETTSESTIFESKVDNVNLSTDGGTAVDITYNSVEQSVTWSNLSAEGSSTTAEKRAYLKFNNGIKFYKGRKYKFSADISAKDASGTPVANVNMYNLSEDAGPREAFGGVNANFGASNLGTSCRTWASSGFYEVKNGSDATMYQFKFLNKNLSTTDTTTVRYTTVHGMKVVESKTYCDTRFNVGSNGSVKYSYSELDGTNAVTDADVANGDVKQFEKYTKPAITVTAAGGYVIDELSLGSSSFDKAKGHDTYTISDTEITGVSELSVTFAEEGAVTEDKHTFSYITLSGNKTFYLNENADSEISVKGYTADGTEYDVTGSTYLTYTTSNPLVFKIENGVIKSTGENGMAIVSATYKNEDNSTVKASVIFQKTSDGKAYNPGSSYVTSAKTGHVDGSTSSYTRPSNYNGYGLRSYEGSNYKGDAFDWKTNKHRVVTGWFYCDGTNNPGFQLYYKNYKEQDASVAFNYTDSPGAGYVTGITKGWHQMVWTIDTRGVRTIYIDGVAMKSDNLTPNQKSATADNNNDFNKGAGYIEMRANAAAGDYYDDFSIADYTNIKPEYSVEIKVKGGSVTAGTASVADGKSAVMTVANGENLEIKAAGGYKITSVERVDTLCLTEGANTSVSVGAASYKIENVSDDLVYNVVLEKIATAPSVTIGDVIGSAAAFKYSSNGNDVNMPEGTFSIIAYATLENSDATVKECGCTIAKFGDGGQIGEALNLPAYAIPEGDGKYAIRVYGAAIDDGSYTIKAYLTTSDGKTVYSGTINYGGQ